MGALIESYRKAPAGTGLRLGHVRRASQSALEAAVASEADPMRIRYGLIIGLAIAGIALLRIRVLGTSEFDLGTSANTMGCEPFAALRPDRPNFA